MAMLPRKAPRPKIMVVSSDGSPPGSGSGANIDSSCGRATDWGSSDPNQPTAAGEEGSMYGRGVLWLA